MAGDKRKSMRAGGILWEGMGFHEDLKRLRLVRGLSNDSGLNNCFLNVVIQCLWHLRCFREALLNIRPQVPLQANPVHASRLAISWRLGSCVHGAMNALRTVATARGLRVTLDMSPFSQGRSLGKAATCRLSTCTLLIVQDLEQRGGHPEDVRVLGALWNIFNAFNAPREELLEAAAEGSSQPGASDSQAGASEASQLPNGWSCFYQDHP
jgi:hypothetical protein